MLDDILLLTMGREEEGEGWMGRELVSLPIHPSPNSLPPSPT